MIQHGSVCASDLQRGRGIRVDDSGWAVGDKQTVVPELSAALNHVIHVGQRAIIGVIHNRLSAAVGLAQRNRTAAG